MKRRYAVFKPLGFLLLFATGCTGSSSVDGAQAPDPRAVLNLATKVADWQIETFDDAAEYRAIASERYKRLYTDRYREPQNHHELDWTNAVLYIGLDEFREIAANKRKYTDWLVDIGDRNGWRTWMRIYHADDQAVGQVWLSLYEDFGDPAMEVEVYRKFNHILRYPETGSLEFDKRPKGYSFHSDFLDRWGWCDALFMAPPIWARLANIRGQDRFLEFMHQEWQATYELLWDEEENFFYRDSRFLTRTEDNGRPIFWSRGNGWVISGLALTIPHLPEDWEHRSFYTGILQKMAEAFKETQREDGTWSMGLLGGLDAYPDKESSGTALITHGLAWGINNGLLDREEFEPVVLKAWAALADCVTEEGIFGYVQPIGYAPGEIFADKTEVYAVGAFLLAATEVYKLLGGE
jgi:rhamnogalacturonyl hydrolase YesR